jgi:hypothetical protein
MTLEPDPVTASVARQSMKSWPLDCRVAALLAMTEKVVTASAARQSMQPEVMDCFTCVSQ